MYIYIHTGI